MIDDNFDAILLEIAMFFASKPSKLKKERKYGLILTKGSLFLDSFFEITTEKSI